MNSGKVKPIGLALIICDQVITDQDTKKRSLIGIFNNVQARQFPCAHPHMCVFVSVTGGHGEVDAEVRCSREGDGLDEAPCFALKGRIRFDSPLHIVEINFDLRNVQFHQAGAYRIDLLCDGVPVLQRPFTVKELEVRNE